MSAATGGGAAGEDVPGPDAARGREPVDAEGEVADRRRRCRPTTATAFGFDDDAVSACHETGDEIARVAADAAWSRRQ